MKPLNALVIFTLSFAAVHLLSAEETGEPANLQRIKESVLKRWADAIEIEVGMPISPDDIADQPKTDAPPTEDGTPQLKLPLLEEEANEEGGIFSAVFKSGGHDFEVIFTNDGKVQYIYEELSETAVPEKVMKAALNAVAGEVLFVEKSTDETLIIPVINYAIAIDGKVVSVGADGKVCSVEDAVDDSPTEETDAPKEEDPI